MPLLVALLPFQHNREGTGPPHCVLVSFLTRRGGACPSSSCCCHFNMMGRAPASPLCSHFIAISTRRGGPAPSPSCSHFLFDTTRRGMPLVVALLPFQHDGVGTGPPHRVLLSFLTRQGGQAPPRVVAHFDATGRVLPSLPCSLIFTSKVI